VDLKDNYGLKQLYENMISISLFIYAIITIISPNKAHPDKSGLRKMNNKFKVYKEILRISLPISLALVIPFLNLSINNYFLGQLGELELGTAGITGVYYLLFAMLGNGLHSAIQTIIARRTGEDDTISIGKTFSQGLIISLFFSLMLMLITFIFLPSFLLWVLHQGQVQTIALEYLNIRITGLPFLFMFQLANGFFMGTTNTRYLVYGTIVQAGLNIILDYAFIFGHWGFPQLGFKGAAVASVIAEIAGMLVIYFVLFKKRFHQQFLLFRFFRFNSAISKPIIKIALPLMGQYAVSLFTWLLFYLLIEHMGERALAVSNLMRNLFSFTGVFIWAFAAATNTMVSLYIGQGRQHEVIGLIKRITEISALFALILCFVVNINPRFFLEIFGLSDALITEGIPVLRVVCMGIILQSIAVIWLNAVTGTGKTSINLMIEIVAVLFYGIYVYMVIEQYKLGLIWVWASEIIYWLVIGSISIRFIYRGKWSGKASVST
jgi:putative MATE family efflux protein